MGEKRKRVGRQGREESQREARPRREEKEREAGLGDLGLGYIMGLIHSLGYCWMTSPRGETFSD
jgi:hypothetical protein